MSGESDFELVRRYVERGSQEAFTQIVHRHMGLVYSAAVRQVRDPHGAQDVSQVVFLVLARKADRIDSRTPLSAWLLNTTRYASMDFLEAKSRRTWHETRAGKMTRRNMPEQNHAWDMISPRLDEALATLSWRIRSAIVLRFFEGLSFDEIAARLGITTDAAKQRVSRGLGQVRSFFAGKGVVLSEAGLATAIAAHAIHVPPAELAGTIATAAHGTPSAAQSSAVKGVITLMAWTKTKTVVAGIAAALLLGGAGTIAHHFRSRGADEVVVIKPSPGVMPAGATAWPVSAKGGPGGVVLGTDGKPLAGINVMLLTQQRQLQIYRPDARPKVSAVTAADGHFELPPAGSAWALVVADERGFAQTSAKDFASHPQLILQPWARIEGVLRIGGTPARNARIWLTRLQFQKGVYCVEQVGYDLDLRTDQQGRFTADRIIPGAVWIGPLEPTSTRLDRIEAKPGETTAVNLGGSGRPLVGRISGGWRDVQASIKSVNAVPDHPALWSFDVRPDGSFRIDDVPPGSYRISISKDLVAVGRQPVWGLATGTLAVTVPPIPGGRRTSRSTSESSKCTVRMTPLIRLNGEAGSTRP